MSSIPETPPARTTPSFALTRLLESADLARAIPHLPADTLHRLIRHCGLEACAAVVAAATPSQLATVLDLDLWQAPRPGHEPQFDHERFGEWIETLVTDDLDQAVTIVSRMDPEVVVAGLSGHLRVFDAGVFMPTAQSDDEPLPTAFDDQTWIEEEVGGYRVRARRSDAWDAVIALLVELDASQPALFRRLMHGCRALSNAGRELDGLDDLSSRPEQQLADMARTREDRRQERGYLSPADARAFLSLARQWPSAATSTEASTGSRSIVLEYERRADAVTHGTEWSETLAAPDAETQAAVHTVVTMLDEAGVVPVDTPRALLAGDTADGQAPPSRLVSLMNALRPAHDGALLARGEELTFLANVLVSGCGLQQGRAFTPAEAADAAAAVCNLGLERWPAPLSELHLAHHTLVATFETGWSTLHREVSLAVAQQLLATIDHLPPRDVRTEQGLRLLKQSLARHIGAGDPWLASEHMDILSTLDTPAWYGLLGLFSECPVLPAVVRAIVERQTGRISPTAFEFIATSEQIVIVQRFMTRLPELLAG